MDATELFAPLGPRYDRWGVDPLVRAGPALAPLPRLAHRRRPDRHGARRRHGHGRRRARARAAEGLLRRRHRPDARDARGGPPPRRARGGRAARCASQRATRASCRSKTASSTRSRSPTCCATSTIRPRRCASSRAWCKPGGTIAGLEFGVPRGVWRPLWELWVRVGLPGAGRLIGERLARGRHVPRPVDHASTTTRWPLPRARCRRGATPGIEDVRRAAAQPRRRSRDVGTQEDGKARVVRAPPRRLCATT